jgi:hypothetical protein
VIDILSFIYSILVNIQSKIRLKFVLQIPIIVENPMGVWQIMFRGVFGPWGWVLLDFPILYAVSLLLHQLPHCVLQSNAEYKIR